MESIFYNMIYFISRIHTYFLTWNDQIENSFTDKQLHFIIFGFFGLAMLLVLHPIFLWLSKTGHTMVISFFYVLTLILVLTFAIEIGQGFTGTGIMEFADAESGVTGFLLFACIFLVIRAIVHLIIRIARPDKGKGRPDPDDKPDYF